MNRQVIWALSTACFLAIGGCSQAEKPATVDQDVAKAADKAAENNAKAADRIANAEGKAKNDADVGKAESQMAEVSADATVTEAEGTHNIAMARCEALSGDMRQACKHKADAAREMTKAQAEELKARHP